MRDAGRPATHQHKLTEIINAATPSSSELPAAIMTSGISGHEYVEPEYELGIPPPTEKVGLKLIVPFALAQMALFIALLGNPIFGRLSDRTTGRWGRRRPWTVGVLNIADAMPQTLAPLLGAVPLGVGAGAGRNHDLLYLTAAALTFLGAVAIIPVKKVP